MNQANYRCLIHSKSMESSSELTGVTSWAKIIEPLTLEKRGSTTSLASGTTDHVSQAPRHQGTAKPSVLSSEAEPFVPRRFPQIMPSNLYEVPNQLLLH
jgi:hypothetical protein